MAGRSDRRRSGGPPGSISAAEADHSSFLPMYREVNTVETSAKKMCVRPVSNTSTISVSQGWANLPDDLLQSILVLLRSPQETIAFAATCRPWHAAFCSCLSSFNLFALFPPVLLRPDLPDSDSNHSSEVFVDPMNTTASRQCLVPWRTVNKMSYIGYSYGNLIYVHKKKCHLFDAYTGEEVQSPQLIVDEHHYPTFGALTAPLASPGSNLLVQAGFSLFQWKVGSKSWLKHRLPFGKKLLKHWRFNVPIIQVVSFKGEIFAMDSYVNLYRVCLKPRFKMQKVKATWEKDIFKGCFFNRWLVVCDNMLLLVGPVKDRYQAVCLNPSPKPRWIKVERLENWAVFVGTKANSQAFACKNPERWGGRSNCIYFCDVDKPWGVAELGELVTEPDCLEAQFWGDLRHIKHRFAELTPIWVFPGVFLAFAGDHLSLL